MFTEHQFPTGELALNYALGPPNGPPLVLVHGVTRTWRDFAPLLPALATRWQIFALDLRGHGRSERAADGRYLVVDYARDVLAFVTKRLDRPAVLYGHSLGALVAAAVAAEAGACGVVLEDPPFETLGARIAETQFFSYFAALAQLAGTCRTAREYARQMAEIQVHAPGQPPTRLGDVRDAASLRFSGQCLTQLDPRVLAPLPVGRWLEGYDRAALLPRIAAPVLLLEADEAAGGMLPAADAAQAAAQIGDCLRVAFPRVGHLLHWAATEAVQRALLSYLESLDVPATSSPTHLKVHFDETRIRHDGHPERHTR